MFLETSPNRMFKAVYLEQIFAVFVCTSNTFRYKKLEVWSVLNKFHMQVSGNKEREINKTGQWALMSIFLEYLEVYWPVLGREIVSLVLIGHKIGMTQYWREGLYSKRENYRVISCIQGFKMSLVDARKYCGQISKMITASLVSLVTVGCCILHFTKDTWRQKET